MSVVPIVPRQRTTIELFRFCAALVLAMALSEGARAAVLQPLPIEDTKSTIYIFRPASLVNAANGSSFYIDGKRVAKIGSGGCTVLYAPPGEHKFEQGWDLLFLSDKEISTKVYWEPGREYVYELDAGFSSSLAGERVIAVNKQYILREIGASSKAAWMNRCHYSPPLNAEKPSSQSQSRERDAPTSPSSTVSPGAN